jgi:hypothetical protein
VLDAVLVAGDQRPTDPAVEGVLTLFVELARLGAQPLDDLLDDTGVVAQPDQPGDDQDADSLDQLPDRRLLIARPPRSVMSA